MPNTDDEPDTDLNDARAALAESQASTLRAATMLDDLRESLNIVKAHQDADHFIEKYRAIIGGTHHVA